MSSLLEGLSRTYEGLETAQVGLATARDNIMGAGNEHYTRKRMVAQGNRPINVGGKYFLGQGSSVQVVARVHDAFVFNRYVKVSGEREHADVLSGTLKEISTYYPEIDNSGTYEDLQNYFNAWVNFAANSGDKAQKQVLAQKTDTLATNLRDTIGRLKNLQKQIYGELKIAIDEVNELGQRISELNKEIQIAEEAERNIKANDLRDQRDFLELSMAKFLDVSVVKNNLQANSSVNMDMADFGDKHSMSIAGHNIVDGTSFHPLVINNDASPDGFYDVYFKTQDHKLQKITTGITGGKAGALIDLCLTHSAGCVGQPGKIQRYIDDLNTFAQGLIENTNNIFAQNSQHEMVSDSLALNATDQLTQSNYNIRSGSLDLVVYNSKGEELSRKTVEINETTTMNDLVATTAQGINFNDDDNQDNNGLNDFDDAFQASFNESSGVFQITAKEPHKKLYLSIEDNGTNFAGAVGLNRFFDGRDGTDIKLAQRYQDDATQLRGYGKPIEGNHDVANKILTLQTDAVTFQHNGGDRVEATIPGFFRLIATRVGSEAETQKTLLDTKQSVYNTVKLEYSSIHEVNRDESLKSIIDYQSHYMLIAKGFPVYQKVIDTLLGSLG
jgi:flagellar hook-associated protein 1